LIPERNGLIAAALPPTYVLRRGYGSAIERMYVFLALLQQLDLEGCLIGPSGAGEIGAWNAIGPDQKRYAGGPSRPFWGVGVRIGSDIKVYDPWRGEAFPANLNQLKTNPDAHKNWFENTANLSKIKPDEMKAATVYLAVPVNSLSPRMEMLHQKLKDTLGVRLAINPKVFLSTFPDPKPIFWNPPNDRFAYGRTTRTFLPRDRGGADEALPPNRLFFDAYILEQVPSGLHITLPELQGSDNQIASERLLAQSGGIYIQAFIEPPNPRERIQRGQFQDAIRDLTEKRDSFEKYRELLRYNANVDKEIQAWCIKAKVLYANLARTVLIADKDERASAVSEAQTAIERHWREEGGSVALIISRVSAPICDAEATFLLGLCKHEMAERKQTRADYATGEDAARLKEEATEAWSDALKAWGTYLESSGPQASIPGRIAEANALKDRAVKFAKQK
jgi:hypothetical protein